MLDRLDAAFESQRRFVANASHELRTPLTIIRAAIEVTLAKSNPTTTQLKAMALDVQRAVETAERLVDALLALARSERQVSRDEQVDLAVCVEDAIDVVQADIVARRLSVTTDLGEAAVAGERLLLERMVANLIENAVLHNLQHGSISVRTARESDWVVMQIANSGVTIPADRVDALFDPFARLRSRTGDDRGFGLGLSIVRAVVIAHGGVVSAEAQMEGGLVVTVRLAASATP
jgi:signal transduction histidine kinase